MRRSLGHVSIRWFLPALLGGLALALGLAITALAYERAKASSLETGRQIIELTGANVAQGVALLRWELSSKVASATGSRLATAGTYEQRSLEREDLLPIFQAHPFVVTAHVGFPDGDSFTLRRIHANDPVDPWLVAKGLYVIVGRHWTPKAVERHYWVYDPGMQLLWSGSAPADTYDPRTRPWYDASAAGVTFVGPYLSAVDRQLVFSLAQRARTGAVFGLEMRLSGYSAELDRLSPTPSSQAAILRKNGSVLALTEMQALDDAVVRNGGHPIVLSQTGLAPLIAAAAASPGLTTHVTGTYRDPGGRTWLYTVTPVRDIRGTYLNRTVVVAVPEDELLAAVVKARNAAFLLCLGVMLLMIPIAYLLSQFIARPLDRLRKDASTLRQLDFSPQPATKSIIAEMEEFSKTFTTMRRHVHAHNRAVERFVPRKFLEELGSRDITALRLGDHIEGRMTLMFSDIRSFTTISGELTPEETFRFVNDYFSRIGPIVRKHGGFVDKYIGDAIFALFPGAPGDAVEAAIEMQRSVSEYNGKREAEGGRAIAIGVGIHRGPLMLGTIGEKERFETTVISDAVNIASRLESLTKTFGSRILTSSDVVSEIDAAKYCLRDLGSIQVKGATHSVTVYEICDADPPELLAQKLRTMARFEAGVRAYFSGDFASSHEIFAEVISSGPDPSAAYYLDRSATGMSANGADWDRIEHMESK